MLPFAALSFSSLFGISNTTMGFAIAILGLAVGGSIAIIAMLLHHQRQRLWHETARLALEKGQPVPPAPLRDEELDLRPPPGVSFAEWSETKRENERAHAFRGGFVLIAVGAGLQLMLGPNNFVGAIPGFIGVALIVNALIERLIARRKTTTPANPRPSSS